VANTMLNWVTLYFGWFYLISVLGFIMVLVYIALSKYGAIKLGDGDEKPEYSFFSWVSMLMAAGFGVGLVFYGMAEPMSHFIKPPHGMVAGMTPQAAHIALQYSFFNWGGASMGGLCNCGPNYGVFSVSQETNGTGIHCFTADNRRYSRGPKMGHWPRCFCRSSHGGRGFNVTGTGCVTN
jgi:hypothetical protein